MKPRTKILAIVNVTPDSFSDGSQYNGLEESLNRCREILAQGADYLDIGGESTRPGYQPVGKEEELSRILPLIKILQREESLPVSVDTQKAWVAQRALEAGAKMINDIWGFQKDPDMAKVAASFQVPSILMHNQEGSHYDIDLLEAIKISLHRSIETALKAGLKEDLIILDPGIGFGKTFFHNWEVLRRFNELQSLGFPLLLGASRKGFLGEITGEKRADKRDDATLATSLWGVTKGASYLRVHNVKMTRDGLLVTERLMYG
ncbi:MAG: dihydropteroate synthase [Tissierellia bacterium]|nr:dihydropteroate synthase [Tissierellia bacterium]